MICTLNSIIAAVFFLAGMFFFIVCFLNSFNYTYPFCLALFYFRQGSLTYLFGYKVLPEKLPLKFFLKCKHRLTSKANSFNTQYNTARNQQIPTLDPSSNDHEAATCSRTASVKIPLNFPDFPFLLHRQLSELGSIESFIVDKLVSILLMELKKYFSLSHN